jgi:hypothetical protein
MLDGAALTRFAPLEVLELEHKERSMRCILISILVVFAAGCNSAKNAASGSVPSGTSMQGSWSVTATATSTGSVGSQCNNGVCAPGTYQVEMVSSPCSVTTPVGTFSVQGPVCFIANNNSGQGNISGTGLPNSSTNEGQGVLIGVVSDPVPVGATLNLVFVAANNSGFAEFTGSGTVGNGTMTGTGSCSSNTPVCHGVSGTFSGKKQ